MSKQNAEKFLEAVNSDASLQKKLLNGPATAQAWVAEAKSAGHDISEDDLRSATEQVLGKPVPADQLVGTLRSIFEGELNDDSLDAVAGGAGSPTLAQKLKVRAAVVGIQQGTDAVFAREGGPIKVGQMPGGNQSNPAG